MALTRPFSDIREQLNRAFYEMTEDFGFPLGLRSEWPFQESRKAWFPTVEISETDKEIRLRANIPGMKKPEDIQVEVNQNSVVLSGEMKSEKKEESENVYHSEFRYGSFYRRMTLPTDVKSSEARAEYKNGVLELYLPKAMASQSKRIPITVK